MSVDPGMPRKVLRKAHELGVLHNDCLVSGDLCEPCHATVMQAFDFFYGNCKNEAEVISAIIDDFRQEQLAEVGGHNGLV